MRDGPPEKLGPPVEPGVGSMLMVAESVLKSLPNILPLFVMINSATNYSRRVLMLKRNII